MNTACVSEEKMLRALPSQLVQRHEAEGLGSSTKPLPTEGKWMVTGKTTSGITLIIFLMSWRSELCTPVSAPSCPKRVEEKNSEFQSLTRQLYSSREWKVHSAYPSSLLPVTGGSHTWLAPAYLKDTPHCGSDYQWQDVDGIRYREILEPPEPTCLQARHRQVGHLSQGNKEGDEDGGLLHRINSQHI